MTPKQEAALRLARKAFEYIENNYMSLPAPAIKALAAIDEALAEQPAQTEFKPDWMNYQQGLADGAAAEREELARFFKDHWRETWTDLQISKAIRARRKE